MANGYLVPWRRGSLESGVDTGFGGSLLDLHRQVNRLFDGLLGRGGSEGGLLHGADLTAPALDLHQDDKQIEITAELPGVKEEDINLTLEDGVLTLAGEKKSEREDRESGYSERSYGRFERLITLPSDIEEEKCSADFRDGVLRITIPRSEAKSRGRRIPLGRGGSQQSKIEAQNDSEATPRQEAAEETAHNEQHDAQQQG